MPQSLKERWDGINRQADLLRAQAPEGHESVWLVSIDDPNRDLKGGVLVEADFKAAGKALYTRTHALANPDQVKAYIEKQRLVGEQQRIDDKKANQKFDLEDAIVLLNAERRAVSDEGSKKAKS